MNRIIDLGRKILRTKTQKKEDKKTETLEQNNDNNINNKPEDLEEKRKKIEKRREEVKNSDTYKQLFQDKKQADQNTLSVYMGMFFDDVKNAYHKTIYCGQTWIKSFYFWNILIGLILVGIMIGLFYLLHGRLEADITTSDDRFLFSVAFVVIFGLVLYFNAIIYSMRGMNNNDINSENLILRSIFTIIFLYFLFFSSSHYFVYALVVGLGVQLSLLIANIIYADLYARKFQQKIINAHRTVMACLSVLAILMFFVL